MGANLTAAKPSATYKSLLQVGSTVNQELDSTYRVIEDGLGEDSGAYISTGGLSFKQQYLVVTADTALTITESGSICVWNDAAATFTLPSSRTATNLGCTYTFFVLNTDAGIKKIVCTDTTNEKIYGYFVQYDTDSSNALALYRALGATSTSVITFDGVGTGDYGSQCTLTAVAKDTWVLTNAISFATGTASTPFSAS